MGLACHIGLILDIPTIGIAKQLLCGELREGNVYMDKDIVAKSMITKEISKPIFISQGHKISLKTAVEIVKQNISEFKLPYPLHMAHKYATKLRRAIKEGQIINVKTPKQEFKAEIVGIRYVKNRYYITDTIAKRDADCTKQELNDLMYKFYKNKADDLILITLMKV